MSEELSILLTSIGISENLAEKGLAALLRPQTTLSLLPARALSHLSRIGTYSRVNSSKQIIGIKRLVKEEGSTVRQCALPDSLVTMGSNNDHGQVWILAFEAALQLDTLDSWHAHVGDETACLGEETGMQDVFGRGERCGAEFC